MQLLKAISAVILSASLSLPLAAGVISVDFGKKVGKIKPMNAVNNGPMACDPKSSTTNFNAYKAAEFPYARLHDAPINWSWAHTVDITCVFPDFDADVNDPASYDFTLTDELIANIHKSGTKTFYRLGQSIEKWSKKYGVIPPKDYKKWAKICEHIIRHYNYGWAEGHHWDIKYWEIWNEPDLGSRSGRWKTNNSPTWNGSEEDFFEFYEITANHLNKCFPELEIGGPSLCEDNDWADNFLKYMSSHEVELDFFSYHLYASSPKDFIVKNDKIRSMLDKYGYKDVKMFLDEWNYLSNWTTEWRYTMEVVTSHKGAAFLASVMSVSQDGPADMLMYYDARPRVAYNGLFDFYTSVPLPQYYALYSWKNLVRLGTQVKSEISDCPDVYVTSAIGENGKAGILLSFFTNDLNVVEDRKVEILINNLDVKESVSCVTDKFHIHTLVPIEFENGKTSVWMAPNSVIFIEIN